MYNSRESGRGGGVGGTVDYCPVKGEQLSLGKLYLSWLESGFPDSRSMHA